MRKKSSDSSSRASWRRRRVLTAGTGVALALAGCLSEPDRNPAGEPTAEDPGREESDREIDSGTGTESEDDPIDEDLPVEGSSWSAFGFDHTNTGYHPTTVGPEAGDLAWTFDAGTPTMNCSSIVDDGVVYTAATGGAGGLFALEAESGWQRWAFETTGYASSAPGFDGDRLFVGTWDHRFHAVDAETGEEEWTIEPGHRFGDSSPAVLEGTIYVGSFGDGPMAVTGSEDGEQFEAPALFAFDAETGDERWRYDEFGQRDSIASSPAVADGLGLVYVVGPNGSLHAVDADEGHLIWVHELEAHSDVSPVVSDGIVYCSGRGDDDVRGRLWALDAETGEALRSTGIDELSLRTSPAVADGTVYVAGSTRGGCTGFEEDCDPVSRGSLFAVDAETGEKRWRTEIDPDTRSSPAVADGVVYVGCGTSLYAIGTDGERLFRIDFTEHAADEVLYVDSSPAVAGGQAYIAADDGRLYAVR